LEPILSREDFLVSKFAFKFQLVYRYVELMQAALEAAQRNQRRLDAECQALAVGLCRLNQVDP
jgi:hypothetical protein